MILTHVASEHHGEIESLAEEARKRFSGEVAIACDLATYEV